MKFGWSDVSGSGSVVTRALQNDGESRHSRHINSTCFILTSESLYIQTQSPYIRCMSCVYTTSIVPTPRPLQLGVAGSDNCGALQFDSILSGAHRITPFLLKSSLRMLNYFISSLMSKIINSK